MTQAILDLDKVWESVLARLQEILDPHDFNNWFANTKQLSYENGKLRVRASSLFIANWIRDHYSAEIQNAGFDPTQITFEGPEVESPLAEMVADQVSRLSVETSSKATSPKRPKPRLQREFGFTSPRKLSDLVVYPGNRSAWGYAQAAAAMEVQQNPLFFYGDPSVGKTTAALAIKSEVEASFDGVRVKYILGTDFVNDFIRSLSKKTMDKFRQEIQDSDVLIIDDIQSVVDKLASFKLVCEFITYFLDRRKLVVICSHLKPADLFALATQTSHMKSMLGRIEKGLVVEIRQADEITRTLILKSHLSKEAGDPDVSQELLEEISAKAKDTRDALGILRQMLTYCRVNKKNTPDHQALEVVLEERGMSCQVIDYNTIKRVVAEHFGLKSKDLESNSRGKTIAKPRQLAMFLCRALMPKESFASIGTAFGGKDHTTVLYACDAVRTDTSPTMHATINALKKELGVPLEG